MEINSYEEIVGVIPTADVVEGRMGLLVTQSHDNDFGSNTDLPGFCIPTTDDEARNSRYVIAWPVNNQKFPAFLSYPSMPFALRQGFGSTANLPWTTGTMYGTNPAAQENLTIPSGYKSLAFHDGTFTFPSGAYVWNAALASAGANLVVEYSGVDAGKLKYLSTYDANLVVGETRYYDSTTGRLTVTLG
jgi:hypothetical protein